MKKIWASFRNGVLRFLQKRPYTSVALLGFLLLWWFCLPNPLFRIPYSTIVTDRNGRLLSAIIAEDGQWRFPALDTLPEKYTTCLLAFEDARFRRHPGVDPIAFFRAVSQNVQAGKVVSGGSTLTMQVIRLASQNPKRSFFEKIIEMFRATRLEARFSKDEILGLYAAHAPFGGNVVGLDAAVWRYFGKNSRDISWAEAATLAVLPNSPALIHPGRNRRFLLEKRNRLLDKLVEKGQLAAATADLAKFEPLPDAPTPLPQEAPHLLQRLIKTKGKGQRYQVTLDAQLQERCRLALERHRGYLLGLGVHNLAAVVVDIEEKTVLAYIGNVSAGDDHSEKVDMVVAPRSSGSILKPYLMAFGLQHGLLTPDGLLSDIPTQYGSYAPVNHLHSFDGAVSARLALVRSLNVPWVRFLKNYGVAPFHLDLKRLGFSTLRFPSEHYGLSLILGGAEVNLLEVVQAYSGMARTLHNFYPRNGKYAAEDFEQVHFLLQEKNASKQTETITTDPTLLSAGAIWSTFEAMRRVERPNDQGEWEVFNSGQSVAWKTGTSFGYRDAWAAGTTARYAVGVWAGNADGEGRPGLLGVASAAPVLFELFSLLPAAAWFDPPYDDLAFVPICRQSGYRATENCSSDSTWIPKSALPSAACGYCTLLHVDQEENFQVHSGCYPPEHIQHRSWFVLPTNEEFYYKTNHPGYRPPPVVRPDCLDESKAESALVLRILYPRHQAQLMIPKQLDGTRGKAVFEVAHRRSDAQIFWHIDDAFVGSTRTKHQMAVQPTVGPHVLTVLDELGNRAVVQFEVRE